MKVRESGSIRLDKELHSEKAKSSIEVTVLGMVKATRALQH